MCLRKSNTIFNKSKHEVQEGCGRQIMGVYLEQGCSGFEWAGLCNAENEGFCK